MSGEDFIVERKIGDLVVRIDRTLCVGFGDCIEVAPDAFEFDDDGIVRFVEDTVDRVERERIIAACDVCPVDALSVIGGDGTLIVPG